MRSMSRLDDPGARSPVRGFADGAPGWLGPTLRNCYRCGGALVYGPVTGEDRARHRCSGCGEITYVNPRLVVTALPITEADELVLIRRAIPPGVGSLGPAGRLPRGR